MLTNIFYLILLLLLIGLGASSPPASFYREKTIEEFLAVLILYSTMLALLYLQYHYFRVFYRRYCGVIANIALIAFFICFFFIFGVQHAFDLLGPFSTLFVTLFSIFVYFFAIAFSHYIQQEERLKAIQNTWMQISFLVPFTIPFVLFIALNDTLKVLPLEFLYGLDSSAEDLAVFALNAALMVGTLVFLPLLMVFFWRCQSLDDAVLVEKLEGICKKAGFKHRGIKILGVMPRALTAAIMGISGRFRYVLFTPALLQRLSPGSIEAVLAHEIGHSQRRHLLMYPLVMFFVAILAGIFFELIYGPAAKFLRIYITALPMEWQDLFSLLGFYVLYALLMTLLLRFVFGYFMRLFERQADLHVFELGMPAQHMIDALNEVAIYSGYTHNIPSWHHYSIQERIDFLQHAQDDPFLIKKHHQKVVRMLWAFFAFVIILVICMRIFQNDI